MKCFSIVKKLPFTYIERFRITFTAIAKRGLVARDQQGSPLLVVDR